MDRVMIIGALWGFAEATLFFIVPDVWLTFVVLLDGAQAVSVCGATLLGALAGGAVMRRWGRLNPRTARGAILAVPGVGPRMVECVDDEVRRRGLRAMISGPLRGVPYKIYAVVSGERRHALVPFLLVSVPARAPRLILLAAAAYGMDRLGAGHLSLGAKGGMLGTAWVAFYIWYFCAVRLAATGDSRRTPRRGLESAARHGCPSVVKRSTDGRRMRRTSWLGAKLLPVCFAAITALSLGDGIGVGAAPAKSGERISTSPPSTIIDFSPTVFVARASTRFFSAIDNDLSAQTRSANCYLT
jgi:membrane protein YqaA with SNARE-associated domain